MHLLISDVHGNADALFAVLDDAKKHRAIEKVWCLGDIAGYGAETDADMLARRLETGW